MGLDELPCRVVAVLSRPRHRGTELGRGGVRLHPTTHDRATIRMHLTDAGRRVLGSRKAVPVRLELEGHASCDATDRNIDGGAGGLTFLSR
jgi:hypothetical protein